jgi:hypothetical protein
MPPLADGSKVKGMKVYIAHASYDFSTESDPVHFHGSDRIIKPAGGVNSYR